MEGFTDQLLVGVRAVDIGGVDECHAGVDDVAQQRDPAVMVGVITPHLVPVNRIAPKPIRPTVRSPPIVTVSAIGMTALISTFLSWLRLVA